MRVSQKVAVSVVFVSSMFMSILDATIVNVALPGIGRDFGTTATSIDSVSIAFLVSLAVFIPASGWLGDRFGARRVLLAAVALFTVASVLCGLAANLPQLVAFRVLQGAGGGMLTPVGMAMLFRAFPPHERVRASSILTLPTALAPALGPVLGGLLVTDLSWRWVFWVNLPIGLAAFVFGVVFLADEPRENAGRFDLPGFLLCGAGLSTFMFGLSEGPDRGWGSPVILVTLIGGALLLAVAVSAELRSSHPLVAVRLLGDRLLRSATLVTVCFTAGFMGTLYAISLYFQDGRGLTPLAAGLAVFPEAIGVMCGSQLASRFVFPRLGARRTISLGLTGAAFWMAMLALLGHDTSLWIARAEMFLLGFCMAHVFVTSQAVAFATVPARRTGQASTLFNALRQVGGAAGVALLTTAMVTADDGTGTAGGHPMASYHLAFAVAAGFAVLALLFAQTIRDDEAGAAIRGPRPQPVGESSPAASPV
ncbi:multidrug efflux MFS transporter [Kineosporia sp. J2-2]|uniref:Multidrug efflux MFS transporter n=1 Tax=Kineosporia corallincola TaxID=2835133 RepID=A0ABS5TKH9_9ACTN|nr:MDR family MFS transporter [Kineosporia corallincola]MBT0771607.1 multidrug efflux MFS transporter [Kineosporia corallincola]